MLWKNLQFWEEMKAKRGERCPKENTTIFPFWITKTRWIINNSVQETRYCTWYNIWSHDIFHDHIILDQSVTLRSSSSSSSSNSRLEILLRLGSWVFKWAFMLQPRANLLPHLVHSWGFWPKNWGKKLINFQHISYVGSWFTFYEFGMRVIEYFLDFKNRNN